MREDGEHGFASRTLETPDGDPTEADTGIMGMACQAPAAPTGRLVCELKAEGEKKGEDTFNKGLAVAKQLNVGRFVSKIDSDGAVFAGLFGCCAHGLPRLCTKSPVRNLTHGSMRTFWSHSEGF
jgi:hypothetical protein